MTNDDSKSASLPALIGKIDRKIPFLVDGTEIV
jgi:hypothetical protein